MTDEPPVVAVFNSNDDTVELIRAWFEGAGIVVVSAHLDEVKRGSVDLMSFVDQHKPAAVRDRHRPAVQRSWMFVQHLISTSPLSGVPAVFTTTNERRCARRQGPAM